MIKALMVDVDGVIVRGRLGDGRHGSTSLAVDLGISADTLHREFFEPHWEDIVVGRVALRDRLTPVLAAIAPSVSVDRLLAYWFSTDARLDEQLLQDLARVRSTALQVHLVTNQEPERTRHLLEERGLGERVDGCHYSAALGCRKPQREFFEAVARRVGFAPAELLLIDDAEENVAAAVAAGWHGVPWTGASTLDEVLNAVLDPTTRGK